jgi:hypothetical protein
MLPLFFPNIIKQNCRGLEVESACHACRCAPTEKDYIHDYYFLVNISKLLILHKMFYFYYLFPQFDNALRMALSGRRDCALNMPNPQLAGVQAHCARWR